MRPARIFACVRSGEMAFHARTAAHSPFRSCAAQPPTTSQDVEARCVRFPFRTNPSRARRSRRRARVPRARGARRVAGKSSPATRGCPDGRRSARRLRDQATLRRSRADATLNASFRRRPRRRGASASSRPPASRVPCVTRVAGPGVFALDAMRSRGDRANGSSDGERHADAGDHPSHLVTLVRRRRRPRVPPRRRVAPRRQASRAGSGF